MKPSLSATSTGLVLATAVCAFHAAQAQGAPAAPPAAKRFELLDPASVEPARLLPAPPAAGSAEERAELAELHALIAAAPPARIEQARQDDVHEDPSIFDDATGRTLQSLPQTWALLKTIQNESDVAVNLAKDRFARTRPYGVDTTLHSCEPGSSHKPTRSYPSGHAGLGFLGRVRARAADARARAADPRARSRLRAQPRVLRGALRVRHRGEPRRRNARRVAADGRPAPRRSTRRRPGPRRCRSRPPICRSRRPGRRTASMRRASTSPICRASTRRAPAARNSSSRRPRCRS